MKLKKPEDEKYFKDIVLNDILDEISNETGIPTRIPKTKKSLGNHLFSLKKILLILLIIGISIIIISQFMTENKEEKIPNINQTVFVEDNESWKMEKDRSTYKKTIPPAKKVVPAYHAPAVKKPQIKLPSKKVKQIVQHPKKLIPKLSKEEQEARIRKRAKAALLEQMKR